MSLRLLLAARAVDARFRAAFRSLGRGMVALDCGANVGVYTELMARSGARVLAFEPDPHAFAVLEERVGRRRNVALFQQAVSDRRGRARLYFHERARDDPIGSSVGSSLLRDKGNVDPGSYTEVETIDLDALVAELGEVQLLKLDVEGSEIPILRKLLETGRCEQIRHLLVELHDAQVPSLQAEAAWIRSEVERRALAGVRLDWV